MNMSDECVYHKLNESKYIFLILYVNDILHVNNDISLLYDTKIFLLKNFQMKDLGETSFVLNRDFSKKQPTVARSSTAAEYRAVADTIAELLWIRSLLTELRIPSTSPTTLWCDNVGATYLTANPIFHARTKHVEFDYHFVPQQVLSKHLRVCIISSTDQHANLLTKALPKARFKLLFNKLNLVSRQSLREAIEEEDPSG
ncbi:unnamed protein product [Spirodela intermedia]|uniref:Uncharacterized protein n=1 Tax=Spirodela intermedia TaxID=51605 RepID=A0ABN7EB50_SPIIN|nr:unnamed protein product [Spirodela intermedia]